MTGRFTSIDPLWEKYYGYTPYHYTRNNPVLRSDGNGFADFIDENNRILNDNINDNRRIAVSSKIMDANTFIQDGQTSYDFGAMEAFGYILPSTKVAEKITDKNKWTIYDQTQEIESGGVGNANEYIHGGKGGERRRASDAVLKAFEEAFSKQLSVLYYVHKHPDGNLKPTYPEDYNAIKILRADYGILVGKENILLFRSNSEKLTFPTKYFIGE